LRDIKELTNNPYDSDFPKENYKGNRKVRISDYRVFFRINNNPPEMAL
jgi:mRNA-degrading endonuclease RelE of RelBE toxin-antitoxin system